MKIEATDIGLEITTEGTADRKDLVSHTERSFKGDILAMADAITGGDYTYLNENSEKSKWCECQAVITEPFIDPFVKLVRDASGNSEWVPANLADMVDLTPLYRGKKGILEIGNIISKVEWHCGALYISGFCEGHEWNGHASEERAAASFQRECNKMFGVEWSPNELIEKGNGQLYRNPQYATGRREILPFGKHWGEAGWGSYGNGHGQHAKHWLTKWMFSQWEDKEATPVQKELIAAYRELHADLIARYGSHDWWAEYQSMHCTITETTDKHGKRFNYSSHTGDPDAVSVSMEAFRNA